MKTLTLTTFVLFLGFAVVDSCAEAIDFAHEVVPILKKHCAKCHSGTEAQGGFSINSRSTFVDGGAEPGDVESSRFIELVRSADADDQMPPKDLARLSAKEISTLEKWVENDLNWTPGFSFAPDAYEPPLLPREVNLPPPTARLKHPIDRLLAKYLDDQGASGTEQVDDGTFLRRVSLDLIGLLPDAETTQAFLKDPSSDKRQRLVDELLGNKMAYTEHWLTFWNDWLRNDYAGTGFITGGRRQVSRWLYSALMTNKPYDQFARELIAPPSDESRGFIDGIKWRGTVSAGQTNEIQFAQSVAQTFLGINMKCASCHDSFIDRWKLSDAYSLAAIYASGPLEIHRCDKPTGQTATAAWVFPEIGQIDADAKRDERLTQLAKFMTQQNNGRFARTIVNRLWCQLMGRGIVHPLDAMHTRPWDEDLLDFLANDFVRSGYDLKSTLKLIATSKAYSSVADFRAEQEEGSAEYQYAGPRAKRMTSEQFVDAIWQLTKQAPTKFDAPVVRGDFYDEQIDSPQVDLSAEWIWAKPLDGVPIPGEEDIVLRKIVDIPGEVKLATAVATCDNELDLFVANRRQASSNDWTQPVAISLTGSLKKGKNHLVAIVRNTAPSPAGFFFQANVTMADDSVLTIKSDDSWQANRTVPKNLTRNGRLGKLQGKWEAAKVLPKLKVYADTVDAKAKRILASGESGIAMVRASLLRSDFFMRSMGRPNRDQIITSRPAGLTTLEAIDLSNNDSLAKWISSGAADLAEQFKDQPVDKLVDHLFLSTLTRLPSKNEKVLITEALGDQPPASSIEDVLWAIVVTPEFMVVR